MSQVSARTAARLMMAIAAAAACCFITAQARQAQDTRYSNNQYGISFQPPQGWTADNVVRYFGPQREDGTWGVLTLIAQDSALDLSDKGIEALAQEMRETLSVEGRDSIQVVDRRKRTVAGLDSLQMDLVYRENGVPIKQRQVYVPVGEHKRTYLFTLVDASEHFDESAAAAESAISSFAPALAGAQTTGGRAKEGAGAYTLLLVVIGVAALGVIIAAAYMLLRRRAGAE
jgi:hypothetical protein